MLLEKSEYISIFIYTGEGYVIEAIVPYVVDYCYIYYYINCYNDLHNVVNYYIILCISHLYIHLLVGFCRLHLCLLHWQQLAGLCFWEDLVS